MTVSRSDRRHPAASGGRPAVAAAATAIVLSLALPGALAAQQETIPAPLPTAQQPLRLEPSRPQPETTPPAAEERDAAPVDGVFRPRSNDVPEAMTGGGVEVDQLGAVDRGSVGTLTTAEGGFPVDMWRGTDRASAEGLLATLPVGTESPAMRDIMRRLLLTRATTPAGENNGTPLVVLRMRALVGMGEVRKAIELAEAVPKGEREIELIRLAAEARLIAGDYIGACRQAPRGVEEGVDVGFWDRLLVLCQGLAKETGKADLGLTILRDTGNADDAYVALVEGLLAGKPAKKLPEIEQTTPLHVAAAASSGATLPDGIVADAGMPVLVALTLATGVVTPEAQVDAAERAVAAGAVDGERLRVAYRGIEFSDSDRSNALSRAEDLPGLRARALLYQAASGESVPSARAEILGLATDLADRTGRPDAMAVAVAPLFRQLQVSSDFLWLAPQAVRTMLRVGDHRTAMAWYGLVRNAAQTDSEAAKTLARLAPLVEVGGERSQVGGTAALGAWWDVHREQEDSRAQAVVLGGVLAALGERIPAGFWSAVGEPDPALLEGDATAAGDPVAELRLNATLAAMQPTSGDSAPATVTSVAQVTRVESPGRKGEIAALALKVLGTSGPAGRPVATGQQAVAAFDAIGLVPAARRLALEILLSRGL